MRFLERFWFGCGHCHGEDGCPLMEGVDPESVGTPDTERGPGLIGAVILVFLVPPATAIGGAYLAGRWWAGSSPASLGLWQAAGAVAGFLAGVGLAKLVFWTRRRFSSTDGGVE
jgi:hypothetical protein